MMTTYPNNKFLPYKVQNIQNVQTIGAFNVLQRLWYKDSGPDVPGLQVVFVEKQDPWKRLAFLRNRVFNNFWFQECQGPELVEKWEH